MLFGTVSQIESGEGLFLLIAGVLGSDRNTVSEGMKDLQHLSETLGDEHRQRRPGGGRKPYDQTHPQIDENFLAVVADHTAGDPMNADLRWTNLSPSELASRLSHQQGIRVSKTVIRQWLNKHGYRRR